MNDGDRRQLAFRLGKMSEADARKRLEQLRAQATLWGNERFEARALGERFGEPVVIQRLDLYVGTTWRTLADTE